MNKKTKLLINSLVISTVLITSGVPTLANTLDDNNAIENIGKESLPIVDSIDEATAKGYDSFKLITDKSKNASTGYETWTKVNRKTVSTNYNFGKHAQVPSRNKVDGYWFSFSNTSWSVGVSVGGTASISVSATSGGSSGTYLKADSSRWSTVNVYGTLYRDQYTVKQYNGAGGYIGSRTEYLNITSNCYNKVIYV